MSGIEASSAILRLINRFGIREPLETAACALLATLEAPRLALGAIEPSTAFRASIGPSERREAIIASGAVVLPDALANDFAEAFGEVFTARYMPPLWIPSTRTVLARTGVAQRRLREEAADWLQGHALVLSSEAEHLSGLKGEA